MAQPVDAGFQVGAVGFLVDFWERWSWWVELDGGRHLGGRHQYKKPLNL
jgi:hypothetical protein